ncbi:hypothetical protein [Pelagibius sp.]|uniref:hypothetical protein n=1 Tax=Pelagibius sp. TaxID=1931238 RepID=UPI003BAFA0F8
MSEDDKIIRANFGAPQPYDPKADTRLVPADLAPPVNPKAGYDPLVAMRMREMLELQTRLVLAQAELQTVTERLQQLAQEVLDGDAG